MPISAALSEPASAGADNLLLKCVGLKQGESVLLVLEPEGETLYEEAPGQIIEKRINALGAKATVIRPDLITDPKDFPDSVASKMERFEHTLFLSRLGDYCRFETMPGQGSKTLCYARTTEMLDAPFSRTCHQLLSTILKKLEQELMQARRWRIQCDLGTDIEGTFCWPSHNHGTDDEFSLGLFPVTTFKPVPCNTAQGKVAISRWLMPGAAAKVQPATVSFDEAVSVDVQDGMIRSINGPRASVKKVSDYYDFVSKALEINRNRVHSWHAGINPLTEFHGNIDDNLEAWGAISFASPRYLHFHTCGDVPPGEIAWSIFNPTVTIDDEIFWHNGQFSWLLREDNREILTRFEGGEILLQNSRDIGV
ncbi:MAG: hypothetical protein ACR2QW_09625 [bacterium]